MNKKIINATPTEFGGIQFKSKSEKMMYKCLIDNGFNPLYEYKTFILMKGFKPSNTYFYNGECDNTKLRDITYTPDFYIEYKGYIVLIEVKGFTNDVFPVKKKLFRAYMEENPNILFFEVHTKKALLKSIEILNNLIPYECK